MSAVLPRRSEEREESYRRNRMAYAVNVCMARDHRVRLYNQAGELLGSGLIIRTQRDDDWGLLVFCESGPAGPLPLIYRMELEDA